MIPPPDSPDAPKYWMHETSGILEKVVRRYLTGHHLGVNEIAVMRLYLIQWINSPVWDRNPNADVDDRADLKQLRERAVAIRCQRDVTMWLRDSREFGVDPL